MKPWELYRKIWTDELYATGKMDLQWKFFEDGGKLYILFQPTHSLLDWFVNAISCIPFFGYALGWRLVWLKNKERILNSVGFPDIDASIVVSGHSYGGAIAVNAGIAIHKKTGVNPELITFGCPKCLFLHPFARLHFSKVTQWACRNDLIAHLPLCFHHVKIKWIGTRARIKDMLHIRAWHYFAYFNENTYK